MEDSENDHEFILAALRRGGFDVSSQRVADAENLALAFENSDWDVIICDFYLSGFDGLKALQMFQKTGRDLPFIVVSGRDDIVRTMLKAGAHDYISKRDLSNLAPVVRHELGEAQQRRLRKIAENKLAAVRQHLDMALEASELGAFSWDMITDATWRSEQYDRILGIHNPDAPVSLNSLVDQVVPEERVSVEARIARIVLAGCFELECGICKPDATKARVALRGKIIRNSEGRPTRIIGTIHDETVRRASEHKIREQADMIQLLLDSTTEAIFSIDLEGTCTRANASCARILGYASPDDLTGKNIHSLIHHHHADGRPYPYAECPMNRTLREGRLVHVSDEVFWRANGQKFEAEYRAAPMISNGKTVGAVVTFADVSEQRELQSRLRQAQKMEAIGQLAGGVAHDFNNVLAVILMQAGLMEEDPEMDGSVKEAAKEIGSAAERGAKLTRQLLLFGRKQSMEMKRCELNDTVRNFTSMLTRIIGDDIRLQFKWSTDELYVHADTGMIEQVVMNLVVNARDAMERGGQLIVESSAKDLDELIASQMPHARPGRFACLCVTDTGSGIPPQDLLRIFEPFYTTKAPGKGTGLGLSTVFGIVRQHGGWVHVESRVGFGSTFRVFLPRLEESAANGASPLSAQPTGLQTGTETILFVEDDPGVSLLVRRTLRQLGYKVLCASTGEEALTLWRAHREEIDLLLTDLVMPDGILGHELALQLWLDEPRLPVVVTSGYSRESAPLASFSPEGMDYLPKPFSPQQLSETLRKHLDRVKRHR